MEAELEPKKANDQAMQWPVGSTTLLFFTHEAAKIVLLTTFSGQECQHISASNCHCRIGK